MNMQVNFICMLTTCFAFLHFSVPVVGQTASEILNNTVAESQSAIKSADIEFRAVVKSPPPSKEEIQRSVENNEKTLRELFERYRDQPELAERYGKALKENTSNVTTQVIGNSEREIEGVYRSLGPVFGGDRFFEIRVRRLSEDIWSPTITLLSRLLDGDSQRSVTFDSEASFVDISAREASIGLVSPSDLGRLDSSFWEIATRPDLDCAIDTTFSSEDSELVCITMKVDATDLLFFARLVVDPSRGFVCNSIEYGPAEDDIRSTFTCSDFFKESNSGLWFPLNVVSENLGPKGLTVTNYEFKESSVRLNHSLPASIFCVDVPAGVTIHYGLGVPVDLKTFCGFSFGIDELEGIPTHKCIQNQFGTAPKAGAKYYTRWAFAAGGIILFIVFALNFNRR